VHRKREGSNDAKGDEYEFRHGCRSSTAQAAPRDEIKELRLLISIQG
jgi:hypothetical protein